MNKLTSLSTYADESGNTVESPETIEGDIIVTFIGKNNRIIAAKNTRVRKLRVAFDCDNGTLILGSNTKVGPHSMNMRIGQDGTVRVGDNVSTTDTCIISAVEGSTVSFGNDVMIASGNQFRADDGHAIFDVTTEKRVNPAKDITIGNHVWMAAGACALGGAHVGDGSVIGFRSLVVGKIPNNAVAVGSPAKVVRRNIAWERPHLSLAKPPYKPDASTITKSSYWNMTEPDAPRITKNPSMLSRLVPARGRRALRAWKRFASSNLRRTP